MGIRVGPAPRGALGGSDATADARAVLGPQSEFLQGIWLESVLFSLLLFDKHRQHIKSRDITLPTKVHLVKAMVFPVVRYGCESWTVMKAEHQRTDTFKLCARKTLENPLDSKGIKPVNPKRNQS